MDQELLKLIVVNFPNYLGFAILAVQQSRIINSLLALIEKLSD